MEPLLAAALDHAEQGNAELRELAHGILPSVLTSGGLRAGVDSLVSRLGLPVEMDVTGTRLPPEVEASVYFVVAEALTNVVKHSQATQAQVTIVVANRTLRVEVRDDGIGGADPEVTGCKACPIVRPHSVAGCASTLRAPEAPVWPRSCRCRPSYFPRK